jgi:hypothetical protein
VAERSKAMVYSRSPTRIAGSNPAGEWMFVLCVVSTVKKQNAGQSRQKPSTDEAQSTRKYKKENPAGGMEVCLL